jgi:hypothetical protein
MELEAFLAGTDADLWEEACFLVANLPYRDLGTITSELLAENLAWAAFARDSLPWGTSVPHEVFRHYVLPHRATQEGLTNWRRQLFEQLYPAVRSCRSMPAAALAVNRWIAERVGFEPTEARDQSPLTTLARGVGRCEELTILYVCAARSVCLPARSCWTPWWAVSDNNHAWVEVWIDGSWHYLGAAEPADSLDQAWFTGPAERAAAVYSSCLGSPAPHGETIYRETDRYCVLNSLATYTELCSLAVELVAQDGRPLAGTPVYASVFNWGQFLPVAEVETDSNGNASLILGPGDYLVSAGDDEAGAWQIATAPRGGRAAVRLTVDGEPTCPAGFTWLRYPVRAR